MKFYSSERKKQTIALLALLAFIIIATVTGVLVTERLTHPKLPPPCGYKLAFQDAAPVTRFDEVTYEWRQILVLQTSGTKEFKITITENGMAEFEWPSKRDDWGQITYSKEMKLLTAEEIKAIIAALDKAAFFAIKKDFDEQKSCTKMMRFGEYSGPLRTITAKDDARYNRVARNGDDNSWQPKQLLELEESLERILKVNEWVGDGEKFKGLSEGNAFR